MFQFQNHDRGNLTPKIYTTIGALPGHIDPAQPPSKKEPWKTIQNGVFGRSLELLMPDEVYSTIWDQIPESVKAIQYSKVILKLEQILEGEFFNEYIKKGNILMLSEGRPGIDNVFSLRNGILRLDIDKESFERAGLQGQLLRNGGRKHVRARYRVEVDLRHPSMLHGKKGFEKVVSAAKKVLNHSLIWLFANLTKHPHGEPNIVQPIDQHHPTHVKEEAAVTCIDRVRLSRLCPPTIQAETSLDEWVYETTEWLSLVGMEAPRVMEGDTPDSYLSRYTLPEGTSSSGTRIYKISWSGLINCDFIMNMIVDIIRFSRQPLSNQKSNSPAWLAITAKLHNIDAVGQVDGYTILMSSSTPAASSSELQESCAGYKLVSHQGEEGNPESAQTPSVDPLESDHPTQATSTLPSTLGFRSYSRFEFQDSS